MTGITRMNELATHRNNPLLSQGQVRKELEGGRSHHLLVSMIVLLHSDTAQELKNGVVLLINE